MKCDLVKPRLSLYLDGESPGRDRLALAKHLEDCDGCADAYASLRNTQRLLAGMGRKQAPPDLELNLPFGNFTGSCALAEPMAARVADPGASRI